MRNFEHLRKKHKDKPPSKKQLTHLRNRWPRHILRKYGLTVEAFGRLLQRQKFCCALCLERFTSKREPVVDHSHKTGKVRGLLCRWCNHRFLGPFERGGIKRVYHAVRYLGWLTILKSKKNPFRKGP